MTTTTNKRGETIENHENGIVLNLSYWDCECKTNYIHPLKKQSCRKCGAEQDDQPNSRANEVENLLA